MNMTVKTIQTGEKKIISISSEDFKNIEELDAYIDQQITKTDEGHTCNICNKTAKKRGHIKEHIEVHINGLSFNCDLCGKAFSSRVNLRLHKTRYCNKK